MGTKENLDVLMKSMLDNSLLLESMLKTGPTLLLLTNLSGLSELELLPLLNKPRKLTLMFANGFLPTSLKTLQLTLEFYTVEVSQTKTLEISFKELTLMDSLLEVLP